MGPGSGNVSLLRGGIWGALGPGTGRVPWELWGGAWEGAAGAPRAWEGAVGALRPGPGRVLCELLGKLVSLAISPCGQIAGPRSQDISLSENENIKKPMISIKNL